MKDWKEQKASYMKGKLNQFWMNDFWDSLPDSRNAAWPDKTATWETTSESKRL